MALPKVTYGNYNYGQYANPTAIKYRGGLGEGLAQGLSKGIEAFGQAKAKKRKEQEGADAEAVISSQKYGAAMKKYLGNATKANKDFIKRKKKEYGDIVRQFRLKEISEDEYTDKMDGFENLLQGLGQLNGTIVSLNKDLPDDLELSQLRNNPQDIDAEIKARALKKGNFIITEGADGEISLQMPAFVGKQGFKQFPMENVLLSDINTNEKIYIPDLAYNNGANANLNKLKDDLRKDVVTEGFTLFKGVNDSEGNETLRQEFIDDSKKAEINKFLLDNKGDEILATLTPKQQKIYYEDNISGNFGSFTGSEDQINEIKANLVNQITEELSGQAVGNKMNKPRESDARVFEISEAKIRKAIADTAGQRKNIADNYESYIDFKGTGKDRRITNYSQFKKQLQSLGIRTGSEYGDDDGIHTIQVIGLGYNDTIDFRTMDSTTMSIILENLQGAMKLNEPATGLP